ncbi:MAG: alanine--tRNA ligase, partial [Desulfobacterium sp.]|nr:alanine--tRNA ligase [Desulfobacterium sp.]
ARFSETLDNGLRLLNDTLSEIKAKGLNTVSGDIIFKLYDTYGFPPDIVRDVVRDVVRDENLYLDMDGFNDAMKSQKKKSRSVATFSGITQAYKNLSANRLIPKFVGYDKQTSDSKVLLIVKDGKETAEAVAGSDIEIVTEETPFYGESGGQTGDSGLITSKNLEIEVIDTIKDAAGIIIHKGKIISGTVSNGQLVTLSVDNKRRSATANNHTATHILHYILKQILGDHVKQAGSFVSSERLRFDFTHFSQVDSDTLEKIETLVNERIRENALTCIEEMDAEKAFKSGATALFEEKYGDVVRVISLGSFSKELCGGTHTDRTGNIGLFKIIGESSVASGVRRIEALTGAAALDYIQQNIKILQETARIVKEKPEALPQKVEKMLTQQRSYEKELEKTKAKIASHAADEIDDDIKLLNGVKVLAKKVPADSPAALRDLADKFRDKIKSGIVVLGSAADSKVFLIVIVTKDLTGKYHAGNIVKQVSSVVGGGGGGRPDMAQAGGSIPEKLDEALAGAYDIISAV